MKEANNANNQREQLTEIIQGNAATKKHQRYPPKSGLKKPKGNRKSKKRNLPSIFAIQGTTKFKNDVKGIRK